MQGDRRLLSRHIPSLNAIEPLIPFRVSKIRSVEESKVVDKPRQDMLQLVGVYPDWINFDCGMKDVMMLNFPIQRLVDPEMCLYTAELNRSMPSDELHDIVVTWVTYMHKYMGQVRVPVMYGIGEFDALWKSGKDFVERYRLSFASSPWVDSSVIPMAPHSIEISYQSRSWLTKCCGFAIECAVKSDLLADANDSKHH